MTQKERLVELLKDFDKPNEDEWDEEELEIYRDEEAVKEIERYYDELADYLLDNGVIVPPCKVGDVLYERIIDHHDAGRIKPYLVEEILVENDDKVYVAVCDINNTESSFCEDQIGKTVFLTDHEARQALKERDEK